MHRPLTNIWLSVVALILYTLLTFIVKVDPTIIKLEDEESPSLTRTLITGNGTGKGTTKPSHFPHHLMHWWRTIALDEGNEEPPLLSDAHAKTRLNPPISPHTSRLGTKGFVAKSPVPPPARPG